MLFSPDDGCITDQREGEDVDRITISRFFSSFGKMFLLPETRAEVLTFCHLGSGKGSRARYQGMTPAAMLPFYHLGPPIRVFLQKAGVMGRMLKCSLRFAPLHYNCTMH